MDPETIKVYIRCRPFNEIELRNDQTAAAVKIVSSNSLLVQKVDRYHFMYDGVFHERCGQEDIFNEIAKPLVSNVFNGFNGCVFAYGQTSTGKTYTIEGNDTLAAEAGIIPRVFDEIFALIAQNTTGNRYYVSASYIEVYNDNLKDLLSDLRLNGIGAAAAGGGVAGEQSSEIKMFEVNEKNIIRNLHVENCECVRDLKKCLESGKKQRTVARTNMNEFSSRSHAIFSIIIRNENYERNEVKVGKLDLVDLAGSERITKSGVLNTDKEFKETTKINGALLALGNVIAALSEGTRPSYRESKLTRLLQDSLGGGNCKTVMIATISPSKFNVDETISTLRFAERVKTIKNKSMVHENVYRLSNSFGLTDSTNGAAGQFAEDNNNNGHDSENSVEIQTQINQFKNEIFRLKQLIEEKKKQVSFSTKFDERPIDLSNGCTAADSNGKVLLDSMNETQIVIEKNYEEISKRKKNEDELKEKLEVEYASNLAKKQSCDGLHSEAEKLTASLKESLLYYTQLEQSIRELHEMHATKRCEYAKLEAEAMKNYKLYETIVKTFIPVAEHECGDGGGGGGDDDDDDDEHLRLQQLPYRSSHCLHNNDEIAELKHVNLNENILDLQLDYYETTTVNYQRPKIPANVRAAFDDFFQTDAGPLVILEPSIRTYRSKSATRSAYR